MKDFLVAMSPLLVMFVLVLGVLIWYSHDFVERCERMGGTTITYDVCVDPETHVFLMSS